MTKQLLILKYNLSGPMYIWPEYNYIDELKRSGWNVQEVKVENNTEIEEFIKLINCYRGQFGDPDLVISSLNDDFVNEELGDYLKRMSSPKVLMCFDNLSVPHEHKNSAKYYDLVWLTSWETESHFIKWGAKTIFLPYAANPHYYKPHIGSEDNSISFIGSLYGGRIRKINRLAQAGLPVKVYSGGAVSVNPARNAINNPILTIKRVYSLSRFAIGRKSLLAALKKSLMNYEEDEISQFVTFENSPAFEQIPVIYSCSSLSLSVSELWNTYLLNEPIHKVHLRAFEIPMSGGIQFATRINELENYFEHGKEAVFYSSEEEFIDLARFYTDKKNEATRQRIKLAARTRSLSDHTWMNRFNNVFDRLGIR